MTDPVDFNSEYQIALPSVNSFANPSQSSHYEVNVCKMLEKIMRKWP